VAPRDEPRTIPLPGGFRAHTGPAGLRPQGDDVALVVADPGTASAAMFTRSRFSGPSVEVSRARAVSGRARAFVVVAKNANVATGAQGRADAVEVSGLAAAAAGVDPAEVLIASTGVIGRPYPMDLLRRHLGSIGGPDTFGADAVAVARAMMTTDTHPKVATRTVSAKGAAGPARVVGVAKGVGMIEPDMATMLTFVLTDAAVDAATLDRVWRRCVDDTFNCLSVDTDTSTSDTAVVLASGAAGVVGEADLAVALREVCLDLTLQLARDGEGATKLLTVTVRQARDRDQARRVAKAILNSPLVKTAVHGADPNWGRVAMAIGKCSDDTDIDPDRVVIRFGEVEAYPAMPGPAGLDDLAKVMAADHVDIDVVLDVDTPDGPGTGECTVYGCDLSDGYVRINADYTT
jgi:glutamate N-acetyltransferase/amino-acid N-acetyltransferase